MSNNPFGDLDDFLALPRVAGLAVSADGSRAVTTVSELNEKRTEYVTAVWELDVDGEQQARRLTRGAKGESSPVFAASGDLLFIAKPRITLCHMVFGKTFTTVADDWDRWPASVSWTTDGSSLIVTADDAGRRPVFLTGPAAAHSTVTRLTDDDFSYTDVCAAPGGVIYALRSSYSSQPHPVRIDPGGLVTALPCGDARSPR